MLKVGFIGAGTVGTALAVRLRNRGYQVTGVASRTLTSAEKLASAVSGCQVFGDKQELVDAVDLVFVSVSDDAIAPVVAEVKWRSGQSVVHCSGALTVEVLAMAKEAGAQVGGLHPMQSFSTIAEAIENLPGSYFSIEAEGPLLETLGEVVHALEGRWMKLRSEDKALYHISGVMACNYLVTLVKLATDLWRPFGVAPGEVLQALMPLIKGTVNNLEKVGLPDCLTGPIARGDLGTLKRHIQALEERAPELVSLYRGLGVETVPIALGKGKVDERRAEEMRQLLEEWSPEERESSLERNKLK